jgi:putative tryptophan/tyrosine transport system substrate-binding protein
MPQKVGFLYSGSNNSMGPLLTKFSRLLPPNIPVIPKHADDDYSRLRPDAGDLIRQGVDVLVAAGGPVSAFAARDETAQQQPPKPPVVFTSATDPVGTGLVGGNLTGVAGLTTEMDLTRLRLLQELKPSIKKIGVLANGSRPFVDSQIDKLKRAADPNLDLPVEKASAPNVPEIGAAIKRLVNTHQVEALLVTADPFFNSRRNAVIHEVAQVQRPAIYQWREFVDDGGLMSFGPNLVEEYSAAANYVVRILNGEPVANIPLYQPTTFELFINGSTANALSLNIPPSLRARAHVI